VQSQPTQKIPIGSFTSTLYGLFKKGIRYSTVVDLGCADGSFYLTHAALGVFADSIVVNVDANPLYESSLKAIKDVVGGHYLIAAVTDRSGEVEMTTSVHPYWNSLCAEDHPYWDAVRHLHRNKHGSMKVPAITLDDVVRKFDLKPPFLLKLDVQGSEVEALRGGSEMLEHTGVVICETAIGEFEAVNRTLVGAGFDLFDVTALNWLRDRSLGWFYPVYLNRRLAERTKFSDWGGMFNEESVTAQAQRRSAILTHNEGMLEQLRQARRQTDA
jgi:FkbM family methyltransferase